MRDGIPEETRSGRFALDKVGGLGATRPSLIAQKARV
jgi:hypothetical protein